MKCNECGQTVVPTFKAGDIVESHSYDKYVVGVVPSRGAERAIRDSGRYGSGGIGFIDFRTGRYCLRERSELKIVHGYIHIDREKF